MKKALQIDGACILIVEDDGLIAMGLELLVIDAGGTVAGPAPDVATAMDLIEQGEVDAAVLDVRLGPEDTFGIADLLARRGVPLIFLTGHGRGNIPGRHGHWLCLAKPCGSTEFLSALNRAMSERS